MSRSGWPISAHHRESWPRPRASGFAAPAGLASVLPTPGAELRLLPARSVPRGRVFQHLSQDRSRPARSPGSPGRSMGSKPQHRHPREGGLSGSAPWKSGPFTGLPTASQPSDLPPPGHFCSPLSPPALIPTSLHVSFPYFFSLSSSEAFLTPSPKVAAPKLEGPRWQLRRP